MKCIILFAITLLYLIATILVNPSVSASSHRPDALIKHERFEDSEAAASRLNKQNQEASPQQLNLETSADAQDRGNYRNQFGAIIRDSAGRRTNFTREEIAAQESQARPNGPIAPAESQPASIGEPSWGYAVFGSGIGLSNIVAAQNGGASEIYMGGSSGTFGGNAYWYAVRYNPESHDYDQVYASPYFTAGISKIRLADVVGDSAKEIIVALTDGHVYLYDQASKSALNILTTSANGVTGLDVADVDGDGANELVLCTTNHLYVYSGSGALKWELAGVGGYDVVAGQMDADSAMEIAVTDGHVVDCATHLTQWTWANQFGSRLAVADIDDDGMKELIVAEGWQFAWAYDVDRQLPKWSISTSQDIGAILVTDIDGDGTQDLLVGQGQWGSIIAFNTKTQLQEWMVHNPEHGVTNIAVADVDNDGVKDLLWGAGASSSGPDYLYVANWQTNVIKWQNVDLVGPFVGPEIGDLDGDGRDELVVVSWASNATYSSGRILVFDAITRRLRAISQPTMQGSGWTGIHDLKLRDVNGDGKLEILLAGSYTYDGVIEIYSFGSNTFSLTWTNATLPFGAPFYSVDAADIDGDGEIEIVGGVGQAHSGAQGIFVYVYSYNTRNEKWHSLHMGWGATTALEIADVNQDGTKEILAMVNGRDVYIFDGPSKLLETILFGPFTSMRVQQVSSLQSIIMGNSTGELIMYRYASGAFGQTYRQTLIPTAVNGFTIDQVDRVWIGSSTTQYPTVGSLTEVSLSGTILAQYTGYGSVFGLRTAFYPASLMFFTTGSYSIEGFPTCTASLSATNHTFASTGGTDSVNITADGACIWGAKSNVPWITITTGNSAGNGVVSYSVAPNAGASARNGTITVAGQTFTVYQGMSFGDVAPDNPFYEDIGKLSARGITVGCGNGNYCPNDPVTREQMAAFIIRALGEFDPPTPPNQRFVDVPPGNQFYSFIDRLAVLQITQGCTPDHLFYCPSDPVKREQMAAFLLRGLGEFDPPTPPSQRFTDVPPANVFYNFIDRLAALQITLGCTPDHSMYCPSDSVTRAQMAAFLVRAFNL